MQEIGTRHPELAILEAFGLGRLSEADSQEIEWHLAACEGCRQKLETVPDDALVRLLQASAADTPVGLSRSSSPTHPSSQTREAVPPGFTVPRELEGHARYLVLRPLGAGGMGTVYQARHRLMDRVVALKIVNPLLVNKPGAVERFTREVRAAAQLVHPNIVTAYDAETVGGLHLLVMECVAGQTLAQVLADQGKLPIARACEYLHQTALGLQHALEHGMVHRDIKPQNLMLMIGGVVSGKWSGEDHPPITHHSPLTTHQIKILDFGLARFIREHAPSDGATAPGTLLGSPDYLAPEQEQDAHAADARADIYSMGCTLYHLLAGQVPFPATSLLAKLEAHRDRPPLSLLELRPEVPVELARVVAKMMAKDPAQRYQTPAEVAEALRPFTQRQGEPSGRLRQPARRSRKPLFALALVAGLLLAGIGYWAAPIVFPAKPPQEPPIVKTDDPDVQPLTIVGGKDQPKTDLKAPASLPFQFTDTNGGKIIGHIDGLADVAGPQSATAVWVDRVFQHSPKTRDYPASHTLPFDFGPGGSFQVVGGRITEAHFKGFRPGNPAVEFKFDHGTPGPFFNMHSFNNHADQHGMEMTFDSFPK